MGIFGALAGLLLTAMLLAPPALAADLPRERIVLKNAIAVDPEANTVVLPLFKGEAPGRRVWYVVTDSSDGADAARLGVVHAPLLAHAEGVQEVSRRGDILHFQAAPDFSPRRLFRAGRDGFPPAEAKPGAVAPGAYSPFTRERGGTAIRNTPIVAIGEGPFDLVTHSDLLDRVVAIDTERRTVTLQLSHGFAEGRRIVYFSTEATDPLAAAIERAVYAPGMAGGNAEIAIIHFTNGQMGAANAEAQGMGHAARHGLEQPASLSNARVLLSPNGILAAFPTGGTARGYSPLWDVNLAVWSRAAIAAGLHRMQRSQADVFRLAKEGRITGPEGRPFGSLGFVVNCPVVGFLDEAP